MPSVRPVPKHGDSFIYRTNPQLSQLVHLLENVEKGEFQVRNLNKLENASWGTWYYASFKGFTGGLQEMETEQALR